KRRKVAGDDQPRRHGGRALQGVANALEFELLLQHFAAGLVQQQVFGVKLRKNVEEKLARRLQVTRELRCARIAREHQARNASNIAELPPRKLRHVQTGEQIFDQVRDA